MDIYISDDEKGENIRRWLYGNGYLVIAGSILGIAEIFLGSYLPNYQKMQVEKASNIYQQVTIFSAEGRRSDAENKHQLLLSQFSSTPYAVFSSFEMVKLTLNSDSEAAKSYLRWIIYNATLIGHVEIALLRLAKICMAEDKFAISSSLIGESVSSSFVSFFSELRGDIAVKQGEFTEALAAYQNATLGLIEDDPRLVFLKMKIDDMAVGYDD